MGTNWTLAKDSTKATAGPNSKGRSEWLSLAGLLLKLLSCLHSPPLILGTFCLKHKNKKGFGGMTRLSGAGNSLNSTSEELAPAVANVRGKPLLVVDHFSSMPAKGPCLFQLDSTNN